MTGSFLCLVRRELYLLKKPAMIAAISLGGMVVLSLLLLLSFYYGNLHKLIEYAAPVPGEDTEEMIAEVMENVKPGLIAAVKFFPVVGAAFFLVTIAEAAVLDEKNKWHRFRMTTPVPAWRFAAASSVILTGAAIVAIAFSFGYMALVCAISDTAFEQSDIAVALLFVAAAAVLAMLFHVLVKLLHSMDKAGIVLVSIAFATIIPYNIINTINNPTAETMPILDLIDKISKEWLPFLPIIIVAALLIDFAACTAIYKRREK